MELYNVGSLESYKCAIFLDRFDAFCRNEQGNCFLEFGNIDPLFLKVWVFAYHSGRVELSRTSAV